MVYMNIIYCVISCILSTTGFTSFVCRVNVHVWRLCVCNVCMPNTAFGAVADCGEIVGNWNSYNVEIPSTDNAAVGEAPEFIQVVSLCLVLPR